MRSISGGVGSAWRAPGPVRLEQGHRQRLCAGPVTGNDRFREAATKIFATGSFWCGTVAMAAARATLRIARETDVRGHFRAMNSSAEGLRHWAIQHGIAIRQSGPPHMPRRCSMPIRTSGRAGRSVRWRCATARSFIPSTICSCWPRIIRPISTRALEAASHGFKAVRELEVRIVMVTKNSRFFATSS